MLPSQINPVSLCLIASDAPPSFPPIEGMPNCAAAQFGIPSIGGKDGGASDAIKHNETGLICDGNNLDDIYSSIDLILKNNSYKEFGEKAKQFSSNFHWDKIIKEYLKLL